jgi:methylamine utilization protein MauE
MSLADLVTPPFLAAAGLLVVSGAAKLIRPDPAARALEQAALPSGRGKVRFLAVAELAIGTGCLAAPGRVWAASLAVVYAAFGAFLLRLLRLDSSVRSCGCVGSRDAPPSPVHVALNGVAAASGLGAAMTGSPVARDIVLGTPLLGVPAILGLAACAYAAYACAVYLPSAWTSYRPHAEHEAGDHGGSQIFRISTGVHR